MNDHEGPAAAGSAFSFTGEWREYLPIALTNLALTISTLGLYRFWATARERRYLWSRTRFIDDSFEWTGTGKEMFVGFLIVMAALIPVFLFFQFGLQALILRGNFALAGILAAALYATLFYLYHVARFRALRYRLSRSWWHGIRGGSDDTGWGYGWSGVWKTLVGVLTLGLMVPWSMTRLWNERWGRMSFGPHEFHASLTTDGLIGRWLLVYLAPFAGIVAAIPVVVGGYALGVDLEDAESMGMTVLAFAAVILFYLAAIAVSLAYYAAFFRRAAAATSVAGADFAFTARTKDWLLLILGHIALAIVTLGFGLMFIGYRNWSFLVRHMEARGTVDLDRLTQSTTRSPEDAEGLATAFDFGAV